MEADMVRLYKTNRNLWIVIAVLVANTFCLWTDSQENKRRLNEVLDNQAAGRNK